MENLLIYADEYDIRRHPFVNTEEALIELLESAKRCNAMFVYTLVNPKLAKMASDYCEENGILKIDLLTDILSILSEKTGRKPKGEAGIIRKMDESYFRRIAAIEFAVKYDDGKEPNKGILEAELVLIGISRTSKTPLSMYLANRNIKVANVPLVPEIPVPKEVYEKYTVVRSTPYFLEFLNKEVNKGTGVKLLADHLGVKQEEVMTFGDAENDLDMIVYAGMGVAMANGFEEVKEAANYITDSNEEDGVAKAIEKFVLS